MFLLAMIGIALLLAGVAAYHRASVLIFDRWQTLQPREWAATMHPLRRTFPFGYFQRSQTRHDLSRVWHWSTPQWAQDDRAARRLFRQLRIAPIVAMIGMAMLLLALVSPR